MGNAGCQCRSNGLRRAGAARWVGRVVGMGMGLGWRRAGKQMGLDRQSQAVLSKRRWFTMLQLNVCELPAVVHVLLPLWAATFS